VKVPILPDFVDNFPDFLTNFPDSWSISVPEIYLIFVLDLLFFIVKFRFTNIQ